LEGRQERDLLGRISGNYDAFLTGAQTSNISRTCPRYDLVVIVMHPQRNTLAEFVALVPKVLAALPGAPKGAVYGRQHVVARKKLPAVATPGTLCLSPRDQVVVFPARRASSVQS